MVLVRRADIEHVVTRTENNNVIGLNTWVRLRTALDTFELAEAVGVKSPATPTAIKGTPWTPADCGNCEGGRCWDDCPSAPIDSDVNDGLAQENDATYWPESD